MFLKGIEMTNKFWKIGKPVLLVSAVGLLFNKLRHHLKQMHRHDNAHPHQAESTRTDGRIIHWARWYDTVVNLLALGRAQKIRQMSVELAGIQPGQTVLDVGCGTGEFAIAAKKVVGQDGQVTGIDAATEMIEVAKEKAEKHQLRIDFQVAAVEKLPFEDNSFDMVINSLVMHHLPEHLQRVGIAEIYRVLRPGGTFFTLDFVPLPRITDRLRIMHFGHGTATQGSIFDLVPVLEANGFVDVSTGNTAVRQLGILRGTKPHND
jgi:ubiquinone/menaquinone biosynthesis C-methylase UbiE